MQFLENKIFLNPVTIVHVAYQITGKVCVDEVGQLGLKVQTLVDVHCWVD